MRMNWHLWSGVGRPGKQTSPSGRVWHDQSGFLYPTVVVDMNLADWALPLSVHVGGPLLGKPGLTFRIGPVNIGWSIL